MMEVTRYNSIKLFKRPGFDEKVVVTKLVKFHAIYGKTGS
jgi:hypothetical protein